MANKKKKSTGQSGFDGNDELRTEVIKIRLSPSEKEKYLKLYFKSSHKNSGEYGRKKLLSEDIFVEDEKENRANYAFEIYQMSNVEQQLKKLNRHLSKMGNNLNQLAKDKNSGGALEAIANQFKYELEQVRGVSFKEELEEVRALKTKMFKKKMKGN